LSDDEDQFERDRREYRRDVRRVSREVVWTAPRILGVLVLITVLFGSVGLVLNLLSQPGRIVSKTMDADNVIYNYEWFKDAYGNFSAKTAQVKQYKGFLANETDKSEQSRLRMEMAAIEQSCRELAQRYNANGLKVNRTIFRGEAPSSVDVGACE
jgi:hypothetical protein